MIMVSSWVVHLAADVSYRSALDAAHQLILQAMDHEVLMKMERSLSGNKLPKPVPHVAYSQLQFQFLGSGS